MKEMLDDIMNALVTRYNESATAGRAAIAAIQQARTDEALADAFKDYMTAAKVAAETVDEIQGVREAAAEIGIRIEIFPVAEMN